MKRVSPRDAPARLRARRWDAIVVGGALPGLIAATQLALGGKRVLLVEEETTARIPPSLRDPFLIPHRVDSPIDRCLRALGLPLIDRRRLTPERVGLQVLLPGVRADVGDRALTTDELIAWGLEKPEPAATWIDTLAAAAEAEQVALEESAFVRSGRGLAAARSLGLGRKRSDAGALPEATSDGVREWARAFGEAAGRPPVSARALGAAFEGIGCFATAAESLTGLLRQRFQALHGEIRLVSSRFSLVTVDGAAAIRPGHGAELWVCRAMVLNAPVNSLRHFIREAGGDADFLPAPQRIGRRVTVCFDTEREQIPEGMARRVIDATRADRPAVRIGWNPSRSGARVEVFASALCDGDDAAAEATKTEVAERVRALMPFAGERLERRDALETPAWDDVGVVEDTPSGESWPREIGVRIVSRPPVYLLPRQAVASLGAEGECFLGWRAGELILSELG